VYAMSIVIITDSSTLRKLDIGGNFIGDDGMSLISRELQYNSTLTELWVAHCGILGKGMNLL